MSAIEKRWDRTRQTVTYRVSPAGTSRFLLFDAAELAALRSEIDRAFEGTEYARTT